VLISMTHQGVGAFYLFGTRRIWPRDNAQR
jgi:hypothetical protein